MSLFQVVFLAAVQGLTEFLPISSSGHLVIFQKFFGFNEPPVAFDVMLHLGSVFAIFVFLKREIFELILNWREKTRLITLIIIGSLPAGLAGFLLRERIESFFNSLVFVGIFYLISAALLFSTKFIPKRKEKNLKEMSKFNALIIGFFQALAILPGVSRSGATIVGSLWQGLDSLAAFSFSFLLAIVAILGAALLKIPEVIYLKNDLLSVLLGMIISAVVSYFSLKLLAGILKSKKIYLFGWYCLILGLWLLIRQCPGNFF